MEQTADQHVSEHHMHILTQMNGVAERSMGEQRTSLISESVHALLMCDEGAAQQRQALAEFNEQLNDKYHFAASNSFSTSHPAS